MEKGGAGRRKDGREGGRQRHRDREQRQKETERESGYGRLLVDNARFLLLCLSSRFPGLALKASPFHSEPLISAFHLSCPNLLSIDCSLAQVQFAQSTKLPKPFLLGEKTSPCLCQPFLPSPLCLQHTGPKDLLYKTPPVLCIPQPSPWPHPAPPLFLMQHFLLETGLSRPVKDSKLTSEVFHHLSEKPIHFSRRGCVLKL